MNRTSHCMAADGTLTVDIKCHIISCFWICHTTRVTVLITEMNTKYDLVTFDNHIFFLTPQTWRKHGICPTKMNTARASLGHVYMGDNSVTITYKDDLGPKSCQMYLNPMNMISIHIHVSLVTWVIQCKSYLRHIWGINIWHFSGRYRPV